MFYRELVTNRGLSLPLFGDHQEFRFFFTWLYIDSCSFLTPIIPTKRKLKIRCPISWLITELTLLWTKKTFCFEEHLKFVNGIVCKLPVKFVISNKINFFSRVPKLIPFFLIDHFEFLSLDETGIVQVTHNSYIYADQFFRIPSWQFCNLKS